MNHDVLKNTLYTGILQVYRILYDEYKNERLAKKSTLKLLNDVLAELGLPGDVYVIYNDTLAKYKVCTDEQERVELYRKLEILQSAIDIIAKEANNGR